VYNLDLPDIVVCDASVVGFGEEREKREIEGCLFTNHFFKVMQRTDRSNSALRPLSISQGVLSRSDGSAQFSFGNKSPPSLPSSPLLSAD